MVICCHFTKVIRNVKSDRVVTCVFIILRMNKVKYRNKNVLITTRSYKYFATMQGKDNKAFTALHEINIYIYIYIYICNRTQISQEMSLFMKIRNERHFRQTSNTFLFSQFKMEKDELSHAKK